MSAAERPSILGVLYAEDFDAEDTPNTADEAPPEPEVIEPVFSAAELQAARAESHAAGRQEAEHGLAASRLHMLQLVASGLAEARGEAAEVARLTADAAARVMLLGVQACLPALCARHGPAELAAFARRILPSLVDEPKITVRVNPHMLATMRAEIATLDAELADTITLLPTDAVPPGDARINWADGSAHRDTASARRAVAEAMSVLGLAMEEHADA